MCTYFNLFGIKIAAYGTIILLGTALANLIAWRRAKNLSLDYNALFIVECDALLGGLIGAKALYLFVSRDAIAWNRLLELSYLGELLRSGFVFYGGLIGGLGAFFLACRHIRADARLILQRYLFLLPFVHAFGRVGCFCAGCCYGIPYDGPFAVTFPQGSCAPAGVPLFPVQLAEAALLLLLSLAVLAVSSGKKPGDGGILLYLGGYALLRFCLEFVRGDAARGAWLGLSTSQWIALLMGAAVAVCAATAYVRQRAAARK